MWRGTLEYEDDAPQFLDSLDLQGIVKFMKSESCKNVFVMAGAGISTSAGIPDFRSPDTGQCNISIWIASYKLTFNLYSGLYANLARLNLPYPEAVFDINFFKRNPRPFYVLAHELAPGKFRPTLTHSFIKLLHDKELLHTCFTQNIDTLERAADVPPSKIIEAHGSFVDQHCVRCKAAYPHDKIKQKIKDQEIPICEEPDCGGYVKPDIVFFGESLPAEFMRGVHHLHDADLLIVMGTSLTVYPFASLTEKVPKECARLLLNLDHVGSWGSRPNDVTCLMPCDRAVRELCKLLGWEEELDALWAKTAPSLKSIADGNKIEMNAPSDEYRKDKDGEGKAATVSDVWEDLLSGVVDKLAEKMRGTRLEEERTEKAAEGTEPHNEKETKSVHNIPESKDTGTSRTMVRTGTSQQLCQGRNF